MGLKLPALLLLLLFKPLWPGGVTEGEEEDDGAAVDIMSMQLIPHPSPMMLVVLLSFLLPFEVVAVDVSPLLTPPPPPPPLFLVLLLMLAAPLPSSR